MTDERATGAASSSEPAAGDVTADDVTTDGVTARAPAHVTSFFAPIPAEEPARAGATGAGLALADGVRVTVDDRTQTNKGTASETNEADESEEPRSDAASERHRVRLDGESTTITPVAGVLDRLNAPPATVEIRSAVPIGAGFGVSAAATLATATAAAERFGLAWTTDELTAAAHAAEVVAGTGLGDAVAAARGGVPVRLAPGDPTHGRVDGLSANPRIEYVSFGELSTPDVLAGETDRVRAAGERALARLRRKPTIETLFAAGRQFTETVGLADDRVASALDAVEAAGGRATMGMLGRTVVATGTGLSDAGHDPAVCGVDHAGVRLVD